MSSTLRTRLMAAVICCALAGLAGCGGSPPPAGILVGKIRGCINVATSPGSKQDDNTVSEGRCDLPADKYGNGPVIKVWIWATGDAVG